MSEHTTKSLAELRIQMCPSYYNFMHELIAVQEIKEGDVICSIPLDLVLAHKSDEEEFATQLGENLDEFTALAVKLLRERAQGERSRYHPHIQVFGSQQS